jgi:hypothetical protein
LINDANSFQSRAKVKKLNNKLDGLTSDVNDFPLSLHSQEQAEKSIVELEAVIQNRKLSNFHQSLNWHDNGTIYIAAGIISPGWDTKFLDSVNGLIQRVYALGHFNEDEEMKRESDSQVGLTDIRYVGKIVFHVCV